MAAGKLPAAELAELLGHLGQDRQEVLQGAQLGEDAAVLHLGHPLCVVTTDPVTGTVSMAGPLAVNVACNDIAAMGAEPVAVLLTLLAPEGTSSQELQQVMMGASETAAKLGAAIAGGHTEITDAVNQLVVSAVVIGRPWGSEALLARNLRPGDALLMTGSAGLEGAAILASDFAPALGERGVSPALLERAQGLAEQISVLAPARIATQAGAIAMHDVTEGGIFGAAWELAEAAGCGLELNQPAILVNDAVRAVCEAADLDVYRLIGSGSLLVGAAPEQASAILEALDQAGLPAAIIGRFVEADQGRCLLPAGEPLPEPGGDQLWLGIERLSAQD